MQTPVLASLPNRPDQSADRKAALRGGKRLWRGHRGDPAGICEPPGGRSQPGRASGDQEPTQIRSGGGVGESQTEESSAKGGKCRDAAEPTPPTAQTAPVKFSGRVVALSGAVILLDQIVSGVDRFRVIVKRALCVLGRFGMFVWKIGLSQKMFCTRQFEHVHQLIPFGLRLIPLGRDLVAGGRNLFDFVGRRLQQLLVFFTRSRRRLDAFQKFGRAVTIALSNA